MTTLLTTRTDDALSTALDGLAVAAERARDDGRTRAVLAAVVQRLEDAADAGLGDADGDPLVVLQRRFGRAHALLAARPAADLEPDLLRSVAAAVAAPAASAAAVRPATPCPVPATC
jgi:predicted transcriptional regulator